MIKVKHPITYFFTGSRLYFCDILNICIFLTTNILLNKFLKVSFKLSKRTQKLKSRLQKLNLINCQSHGQSCSLVLEQILNVVVTLSSAHCKATF